MNSSLPQQPTQLLLPPPTPPLTQTQAYEPKYFWFEIFETLRKLALTGFLVFLVPGTAVQIVISMIMSFAAMRVYSGCAPFIEDSHDRFSEVAQVQLFFTMFGALAMKVNLEGEDLRSKKFFDLALTLLQFVPAAITLLYNMYEAKSSARKALQKRIISKKEDASEEGDMTLEKNIDEEEGNGMQLDTFNPVVASTSQTKNKIINKESDWEMAVDEGSGESYYYNKVTRQVRLVVPDPKFTSVLKSNYPFAPRFFFPIAIAFASFCRQPGISHRIWCRFLMQVQVPPVTWIAFHLIIRCKKEDDFIAARITFNRLIIVFACGPLADLIAWSPQWLLVNEEESAEAKIN